MLTIRKQNFESQLCYCCNGIKANYSDPNYAVTYRLYHKLPDENKHIPCQVVIPRCKYCAEKMKPIFPISIICGIIGAIAGFLYTFCAHGIWVSLLVAAIFGAAVWCAMLIVSNYAFSVVYNQMESDYEIVNLLRYTYGWQTDEPKKGDADYSFTDEMMHQMFEDLVVNHNCEYGDI